MKLDGSVILITGASSGIGEELARQLAGRASQLILVARREERLLGLKEELTAAFPNATIFVYACDITDRETLDRVLERIESEVGAIDILINNAGAGAGSFLKSDWQAFADVIALNVTALTYLSKRLIGPMVEKGCGGLLFVGSLAGLQSLPHIGVYSASKHFVQGLSEALRAEVSKHGVVITVLCPGPVATTFMSATGRHPKAGWLVLSAGDVARQGLRGFEKNRAVVVPGFLPRIGLFVWRCLPAPLVRWLLKSI